MFVISICLALSLRHEVWLRQPPQGSQAGNLPRQEEDGLLLVMGVLCEKRLPLNALYAQEFVLRDI